MGKMDVHYSAERPDWETPEPFFTALNREFDFTLDVCATEYNAKCHAWIDARYDGLSLQWHGVCWMNPPYGREIGPWVEKAYREAQRGCVVVCLLPARTDTRWWHTYVMRASEIRFVKGRIKFVGAGENAPFPNAVVVFRPESAELIIRTA